MRRILLTTGILLGFAFGQSGPSDVFRIGPGVTAPVPVYKPEPQYSPEARAAEIHGAVMFQLVVDEQGHATNIKVVNPLGFGLDERAREAIGEWRFQPGVKDGKAVRILATIEVHFRLRGRLKVEENWNQLRRALQLLQGDPVQKEQALRTIEDLAHKKFPAAMYEYGRFLSAGKKLSSDANRSQDLIAKAAEAKYGPAMFDLASASIQTKQAADLESAKEMIRKAAGLGSADAQYFLALVYEKGNRDLGFQQDDERSVYYYRSCAAAGKMQCQFRLGELILNDPSRQQSDIVEAIAWLELATDQGDTRARTLGPRERASLTPEQITAVTTLKPRLVHLD